MVFPSGGGEWDAEGAQGGVVVEAVAEAVQQVGQGVEHAMGRLAGVVGGEIAGESSPYKVARLRRSGPR
ncbi:hypothetical protein [Streptomyces sp. NBC_00078]|uniref:hypothetical protein n=1 Tax=Streptomyces sp. NBC_00078 TaxID=2975643 RepID=UPI002B1CFF68|nr:hypothetical protein [Streptomyces sp. NBC_00078]